MHVSSDIGCRTKRTSWFSHKIQIATMQSCKYVYAYNLMSICRNRAEKRRKEKRNGHERRPGKIDKSQTKRKRKERIDGTLVAVEAI